MMRFLQNVLVVSSFMCFARYASSVGRTTVSLCHGMPASVHKCLDSQHRRNFSKVGPLVGLELHHHSIVTSYYGME